MLDFDSRKRALKRLKDYGREKPLILPLCAAAAFFVKAFFAVYYSVSLRLSDKDGNFLGVERKSAPESRPKKSRQDDIIHIRRPFLTRLFSFVLAVAVLFFIMPELGIFTGFEVEAATNNPLPVSPLLPDTLLHYFTQVPGAPDYYYLTDDYRDVLGGARPAYPGNTGYTSGMVNIPAAAPLPASQPKSSNTPTQGSHLEGFGVAQFNWSAPNADNLPTGVASKIRYNAQLIDSSGVVRDSQTNLNTLSWTANAPAGSNYSVTVSATIPIQRYRIAMFEDTNTNPPTVYYSYSPDGEFNVISDFAKWEPVNLNNTVNRTPSITRAAFTEATPAGPGGTPPAQPAHIVLEWNNITGANYGPLSYAVYRSPMGSNLLFDNWRLLDTSDGSPSKFVFDANASSWSYQDTSGITQGSIYSYYIVAYYDVFAGVQYANDISNPALNTDYGFVKSPKSDDVTVGVPPARISSVTVRANATRDRFIVDWGFNGTVSGFEIFRSPELDPADVLPEDATYADLINPSNNYLKLTVPANAALRTFTDDNFIPKNNKKYYYYVVPYILTDANDMVYGFPKGSAGSVSNIVEVPMGFTATPSDGQVDLRWNAVPNAAGYYIYIVKESNYDGSPDGTGIVNRRIVRDITATSYTDLGLNNNDIYSYQIRAFRTLNTDGAPPPGDTDIYPGDPAATETNRLFGSLSDKRTVTVGSRFDPPQNVTATPADGQITVAWERVTGAEGYAVYAVRGTVSQLPDDAAPLTERTGNSFIHGNLVNEDVWTYFVKGYKIVNGIKVYSDASYPVSAQVGQPFFPPTDVKATVGTGTGAGNITVSWTAVPGAAGYVVYAQKAGEQEVMYDVTRSPFIHTGVSTGEIWTYWVKAYKLVGNNRFYSGESDSATVSIGYALDSPRDFNVTANGGTANISWTGVTGAQGYVIYASAIGQNMEFDVARTTYAHTGLLNGETWSYYAVAYRVVNGVRVYSPRTQTRTITIGAGVLIEAPRDFTLNASGDTATLTWTAVAGAEGYEIWANNSLIGDSSRTTFTHTGLRNGDSWTYRIRAYRRVNGDKMYSDFTQPKSFTVGAFIATPRDFNVTVTNGTANLSWSAVAGVEGYEIWMNNTLIADASRTTYADAGLRNGETRNYRIRAYRRINGEKVYSDYTQTRTITIGTDSNQPTDFIATPGNRRIDLTWGRSANAEGYVVYLFNESTQSFEPITVTATNRYAHENLINGRRYVYMIRPYRTVNGERIYGDYSLPVTAVPSEFAPSNIDMLLNIKGTAPYGISNSHLIAAAANHGAFNTDVDIYFTVNELSTEVVKDVVGRYGEGLSDFIIFPIDIEIYEAGTFTKVVPNEGFSVTITMPIPDRLVVYRDYISLIHISQDNRLEVLPCVIALIDDVWCIQFECSDFSPFALVIYRPSINNISSGSDFAAGSGSAGGFNTGVLALTVLPDIMLSNRKLRPADAPKLKTYKIKSIRKI